MNDNIQTSDLISDQILTIAASLPEEKADAFLNLPELQRTHSDWLLIRARLYQALALQQCESIARQQLQPLDDILNTCFPKPHEVNRLRWRWGFFSH